MIKNKNIISRNVDLRKVLPRGIDYHDDNVILIDSLQNIDTKHTIMKMDAYIVMVCLKGESSFNINNILYTISEEDFLVCHPNAILEYDKISKDFDCCGFVFSSKYVRQLNLLSNENWNLRVFLEKNPVFSLTSKEVRVFRQYYDLLLSKFIDPPHKYQKELIKAILQAFSYDFYRVREHFIRQALQKELSSAENLFKKFINLLSSFAPQERKVTFYAEKLFVSSKYLSKVSKSQSGYTASELINKFVTREIEFMLKHPDKSIKEIAHEMNFPNTSFFGKYVKANLGISPRQYRKRLIEKEISEFEDSDDE